MMRSLLAVTIAILIVAGCVYPAPLELDAPDAGPSSMPYIVSASPVEFAFPGIILVERGDERWLTLTLKDEDLDDNLNVRLYVNYGRPTENAQWSECAAVPSGEQIRLTSCRTAALCNPITEGDTSPHILEAMVADRKFLLDSDPLADGQPLFRALPANAASSLRAWVMQCEAE